ncbi:MAG: carbohydrate kinase [Deltaproteobacteria bacterium]|nr:carbohydrate kinase [Deltaproteobacteria bacterium]
MVVCMGEALVDFLPERPGARVRDTVTWTRCSGGSPANVAVGLARLEAPAAFLGVVGEDEFGHFLKGALAGEGVDVSRLRQTREGKTGLVFISVDGEGNRSFSFHRTRSAESLLGPADVDGAWLSAARVLHLGTNSLLLFEAQQAAFAAVGHARAAGRCVTADPNLRLHAWPDPGVLRGLLDRLLPGLDVVKLAEDEYRWVTGEDTPERALRGLAEKGVALPVITLGPAGALGLWQGRLVRAQAPQVQAVDTTGAGDGFMAGLLAGLSRSFETSAQFRAASSGWVEAWLAAGCEVGSRVCTRMGAVAALPHAADVTLPG